MNEQFCTFSARIVDGIAGMLPPRPTLLRVVNDVSLVSFASRGSVPVSRFDATVSSRKLLMLATCAGSAPVSVDDSRISDCSAVSCPICVGIVVRASEGRRRKVRPRRPAQSH